jgi:hypothetical protein
VKGLRRVSFPIAITLTICLSSLSPLYARTQQVQPQQTAQPQAPPQKSIAERLLERGRVINMVDDFLEFWAQAGTQPLAKQRWFWRRTMEAKYRDFFEVAVYRGADAARRRAMIDEFLVRIPERIGALREFNKAINNPRTSALVEALVNFRAFFPDFKPKGDIYLGISLFRFDGAIRPMGNEQRIPDTLCLGAEVLAGYSPEQLKVALAHELFHLHHFSILFQQPVIEEFRTPHMPLMIEGMAVAASEWMYPNLANEIYLHFSGAQLMDQKQNLRTNSADFLDMVLSGAPPERYEPWFAGSGPLAPARGGYLLGHEVVRRMMGVYTLPQMVFMKPAELREHAQRHLADMAGVRVMIAHVN